jgi:hypothetical protein
MIDVWVDGGRRRRQALQGGAGEWGGYISIVRVESYTLVGELYLVECDDDNEQHSSGGFHND